MGHRPDSTLGKRKIMIGMLTAGMTNKHVVLHFQACESTISSLRAKICQLGSVENHADKSRKTTTKTYIDKVTSFRRNRFLSRARVPGLVRDATGTRIFATKNSSKTDEGCASALASPIRWCSVNCLHKRLRLNWSTTHCRCILDEIEMKLFSRKTSEMARHFFN